MEPLLPIRGASFRRVWQLVLGAVALTLASSLLADYPSPPAGGDSTVIVAIDSSQPLEPMTATLARDGFATRAVFSDLHAIEIVARSDGPVATARRAEMVPGVRYAEPVTPLHTEDEPRDDLFAKQSTYLNAVKAPQAWNIEKGRPEIVVAVIDTGVDVTHPDLQANVWINPYEVADNGIDDDGNGCVDDVNGCAFLTESAPGCRAVTNGSVVDEVGHGTFVAGVIAAPANGFGIVGVARGVRVMAVKVLDCYGAGDSVAVARGITYAVRNGASVINVSLGGLDEADVVLDAVSEAGLSNVLVVAAAGNDGTEGLSFPARIPSVFAVGAMARGSDERAEFSSYGPGIDVVAAGESVWGPVPPSRCFEFFACFGSDPYAAADGTSFSAPQVSGLVALMLSMKPDLTREQIVGIVRATAAEVPEGETPGWAGAGKVNMVAALNAVRSGAPAGEACIVGSVIDGESFTCTTGRMVRMLQIDAPDIGQCGGDWAKAALEFIFLTPGRTVYLQYDTTRTDDAGRVLGVPIWRGNDGADYNLSIVLAFVGLARAADVGADNVLYREWAFASEGWAAAANWNMWAEGKPFRSGC